MIESGIDHLPPLIAHMESRFGTIERGWTPTEWNDPAIQIVEFKNGLCPNVTVLSTLGVSQFELSSPVSGKNIHQELFLMVNHGQLHPRMSAVLDQIAREAVRNNRAVLRGDLIRKEGKVFPNFDFVAIYSTLPVYYPNDFWTFSVESYEVVFSWLLPLKQEETQFVQQKGWRAFEELLDAAQFELYDLQRPSVLAHR